MTHTFKAMPAFFIEDEAKKQAHHTANTLNVWHDDGEGTISRTIEQFGRQITVTVTVTKIEDAKNVQLGQTMQEVSVSN